MKPRLSRLRKVRYAEIPKHPRNLFERFRSGPVVARVLAGSITLLKMLGDAIEPILGKGDARRGFLFGLGAFVILGVLVLVLWRPSTFAPVQTIMVSVLVLISVIAMLIMDLLD